MDFSTTIDDGLESLLWIIYLSGATWILGYFIMIPFGSVIYAWLFIESWILYQQLETASDYEKWLAGPLRRAVSGSFIYLQATFFSLFPVLNWLTSPILGWIAIADYYDYKYDIMQADWEVFIIFYISYTIAILSLFIIVLEIAGVVVYFYFWS